MNNNLNLDSSLSTILPLLSTLTPEASASIQNLIDKIISNPLLSALNSLTAIPLHPYDQLKFDIYGPEYKDIKFKTIDEIPAPINFVPEQVVQTVTDSIQKINNNLLTSLERPIEQTTNTILNTVSGDQIISNINMQKKHIEFIELIKQIPVGELTNEQIDICSKKIILQFIETYKL